MFKNTISDFFYQHFIAINDTCTKFHSEWNLYHIKANDIIGLMFGFRTFSIILFEKYFTVYEHNVV